MQKTPNVYTTGDLTIKGITKPVTFDLATTANTATTNVIDRTKFDIKYGSGSFLTALVTKQSMMILL
jgi:polyisoprenoid-binding protein YceI